MDVRAARKGNLQCEFQIRVDARVHHLTWEGDSEAALRCCLHKLSTPDLIKTLCRSPDTRDDIPSLSGRPRPTHEQPYFHLILPHSLCIQLQVAVNAPDVTFTCYKLLLVPPPPPGQNHGLSASSAPPKKSLCLLTCATAPSVFPLLTIVTQYLTLRAISCSPVKDRRRTRTGRKLKCKWKTCIAC